jgi:hypothetical protein
MTDINRTLEVILKEYPSSLKMLHSAEYLSPNVLRGKLKVNPGWNYASDDTGPKKDSSPVSHFTLGEAAFSHNQMAYVLLTYMAQVGALDRVRPIPLENMNERKFDKMVVTKFNVEFKQPFLSTEEYTGQCTITRHKVMRTQSGIYLFMQSKFSFMDGKAYGSSSGAIQLKEDEVIL